METISGREPKSYRVLLKALETDPLSVDRGTAPKFVLKTKYGLAEVPKG